jgi:PhnB protein
MPVSVPEGYHTVTPRIVTRDVEGLVGFLKQVFGASGDFQPNRPSEVRLGDSLIMLSGTEQRDPMPAFLYVYLDDVDETYRRALAAGATSLETPRDEPYGDRRAMFKDSWNNIWQVARRIS